MGDPSTQKRAEYSDRTWNFENPVWKCWGGEKIWRDHCAERGKEGEQKGRVITSLVFLSKVRV